MPSNFEQLVFEIIATDRNASAAFDRFRQKVDQTSRSVDDNTGKMDRNAKSADKLGKSFWDAVPGVQALGGASGMGLLIGAGVALAPVIATVGVGLAGFGAAAIGVAKPVLDAAQKTGGLAKNMATLDPAQRKLAQSILGLGDQYKQFEKALQPEVLGVFNKGIEIAGHLLKDVQPVAKATGTALDTLLTRVDKEFQSGTWQQFFTWMAANVGPDFQQIGTLAIDLLNTLPHLLQALQPVAHGFLSLADGAVKAADAYVQFIQAENKKAQQPNTIRTQITDFIKYGLEGKKAFETAAAAAQRQKMLNDALREGNVVLPVNDLAVKSLAAADAKHATAMQNSAAAADLEKLAIKNLTGAINNMLTPLLTAEQDEVAWKLAQKAATQAIDQNKNSLDSNRKSALAARQAIIQSTQSALAYAQAEVKQHGDVQGASRVIQDQIRWLQQHAAHSKIAKDEIDALRAALRALPANVNSRVNVIGSGRGGISFRDQIAGQRADGTLEFHSKGARIPGYGGGDIVPAMLEPGETVVPKHLTAMVAPLMKAYGIRGFAAGGLVGNDTALTRAIPWMSQTEAGFERSAIMHAIADMKTAAHNLARQSLVSSSAIGGDEAANMRLARSIFPWGGIGEWGAFVQLVMAESGFNRFARNPSSGAYGIAQALPPTKYPFAGQAAGGSHAGPQLSWMFGYIRSRYGDPIAAENHERNYHWYDQGGWLPPGLSLAYNGTGAPERVGGTGGNTYIININALVADRNSGRLAVEAIKKYEQGSGSGWRS